MSRVGSVVSKVQEGSLYVLLFLLPFSKAAIEIAFGGLLLGWLCVRLDPRKDPDLVAVPAVDPHAPVPAPVNDDRAAAGGQGEVPDLAEPLAISVPVAIVAADGGCLGQGERRSQEESAEPGANGQRCHAMPRVNVLPVGRIEGPDGFMPAVRKAFHK